MPTPSYDIASYFKHGKTFAWAQYVDNPENGGNGNGKVDGNEIQLFTKIIEHRYNGFKYDFNELDSKQSEELNSDRYQNSLEAKIAQQLYFEPNMLGHGRGPDALGYTVSKDLKGYTGSYEYVRAVLNEIAEFPVQAKKYETIKHFLTAYAVGGARNGIFEQLGSEWGEGVTNGDAMQFLKAIIDCIPEDKKESKDYKRICSIYQEYSAKPADEKFCDSKYAFISSMFSLNTLDQLDDSVERLFDI